MTRRTFVFGLLALALTAVETALLASFGLHGVGLYLALGVLFFVAVRAADIEGAAIAALVGYGWDVFSGAPIGLSVAPAVGIFVGVRLLSQTVEVTGVLRLAILGFLGVALHGSICFGLLAFSGGLGALSTWPYLWSLLGHSTAAALFVAPVFFFTHRLDRLLGEDRHESEVWLS